jgi:ankyrin repeat protein
MLVEQRKAQPDYREPTKLKKIFKSKEEKAKLENPERWEFSKVELDRALTAVISKHSTPPGLVQAFLDLGAQVNFVELENEKKSRRSNRSGSACLSRSSVLQRTASMRRSDLVGVLAGAGADQETLDEGLQAALASNDRSGAEVLLRHGANVNKCIDVFTDAIRLGDEKFVRLLLRAPKSFHPDVLSASLFEAAQQRSEVMTSLLIGYGANPNYDNARAFNLAVSSQDFNIAVLMAAGPTRLKSQSLISAFAFIPKMSTLKELEPFTELLLCCGLPSDTPGLAQLLIVAVKSHDAALARLFIDYGVSADGNQAEALRVALTDYNWDMVDILLKSTIAPMHASLALQVLPRDAPRNQKLAVVKTLAQKGASGQILGDWLIQAVEDNDSTLLAILVNASAPLDTEDHRALKTIIEKKDKRSLKTFLAGKPSSESLAPVFPFLRRGFSQSWRLEVSALLLACGARGPEVDRALIDAVADTTISRDPKLIEELVRHHANVNYESGRALQFAVAQADVPIVRMLCGCKPTIQTSSAALPLAFERNGKRHGTTLQLIELLSAEGVVEAFAIQTLQIAIEGGKGNLDIVHRLIGSGAEFIVPAFQLAIALESTDKKLPILAALLKVGVPQASLDAALVAETRNSVNSTDQRVLQLLLDNGASVDSNDGEAVTMAVTSRSASLIRLLLHGKQQPSKHIVTKSFRSLFHSDDEPVPISVAIELLERGIEQPAIDSALRITLSKTKWDDDIEALVDLLLKYGANVNTADGTCFGFAAQKSNFTIFVKLLNHGPDLNTIIPCLILSKLEESALVKALNLCFDSSHPAQSFDPDRRCGEPLLITALREYPRGEALVKLLLRNGCNRNATCTSTIDPEVGDEIVPVLTWAIAQAQKAISTSVILALIQAGASTTRRTTSSDATALHIAAREGRPEVVDELLAHDAEASARNKSNYTPLFYASRMPVPSIVRSLCRANALTNDGSLHEAARRLNLENASLLIQHGHNPNFPCRLHSGRNALGELCIGVDITNADQRTKLRRMIRLLVDAGCDAKFKARNEKSAVVLALDNPHSALEVTEALLETEIWNELNDEQHMYKDSNGLWYSPIKYAELVPSFGRDHCRQELLELLLDKGCKPRFYSEDPEQPRGAIGLPPSISRLASRHREHQLSLQLAKEVQDHARMLEELSHQDALRRKKEQDDADLVSQSVHHQKWLQIEQSKHDFEIERVRAAERMKRQERVATHNLLMEQEQDAAGRRMAIESQRATAALQIEARAIQQRNAEVDYRVGRERKMLEEKDALFERNLRRQKEVARLHERVTASSPPQSPLRLEYGSVD